MNLDFTMADRSFFMNAQNAERVRNMSEAEFKQYAMQELDKLSLMLRTTKKALRAKRKAMSTNLHLTIESARDGIDTTEKCRKVLAELRQKMKEMDDEEVASGTVRRAEPAQL